MTEERTGDTDDERGGYDEPGRYGAATSRGYEEPGGYEETQDLAPGRSRP